MPAPVWRELIDAAHDVDGEVEFYAETLGCTVEQVDALGDAGFDYLFNSAKWWDFQEPWLLDQYNQFRHIAPSVAFPESHDTERLAADVGSQDRERLAAILKMRYLFSACFSAGVMMPIGYEYGFTRKMDVVKRRRRTGKSRRSISASSSPTSIPCGPPRPPSTSRGRSSASRRPIARWSGCAGRGPAMSRTAPSS